ncbi:TIGR02611 family protein [Streptacidiphilus sp. ASG 303]|uniref:TIGR02611 family protein n=1 Tax=Streptacidiphilus sp. ASG 303 TaxID=2896847 RepID=UPI0027E10B7B|nr:TIGR02611 family protein [Streptacidiphilus sp. ASG 303]
MAPQRDHEGTGAARGTRSQSPPGPESRTGPQPGPDDSRDRVPGREAAAGRDHGGRVHEGHVPEGHVHEGRGGEGRDGERPRPRYGSRAPAFIRRSRSLHLTWRIGILVVGVAVIAGGVLLLPLPGPGWAVIFGGLAILATEFAWAQRLLHWTKAKLTEYARKAVDPRVRRRNLLILAAVLVLLAAGAALYVSRYGWALPRW